MAEESKRSRGVTPELRKDYNKRTSQRQAAFLLPYLQPGQ